MGELLNDHNGISLNPQLKDVGYLTSGGKKAVGILGEVMLVDHAGTEVDMHDIDVDVSSVSSDASCYIGKSDTATGGDFDVTYTAATQVTFSNYPTDITGFTADDIELIRQISAAGTVIATYNRDDATMSIAGDVLTVTEAAFGATDTFIVVTNVPALGGYDAVNDLIKVGEQSPLNEQYVEASIVDTTNVASGTYYPGATGMVFGAYKNLSITGKLIDGAGETTTLTWEVSNDEDTAAADWVGVYGYNAVTDTTVNSVAVTNDTTLFAVDFDNFNYRNIRFLITTTAATNTVIIKVRRSY